MLWSPHSQLHYPLENQANDYSGNARHGTVFGSGVYATRPNAGRCLYFDGTGDYVTTPSFGLSGTVVVFAAWTRCKLNLSTPQCIMGNKAVAVSVGFILYYRNAGTYDLGCYYANGSNFVDASATNYFAAPYEDCWVHICIATDYSGKNVYFYRNGLLFSTVGMTGTPVFPSASVSKFVGLYYLATWPLTLGYLQNVQLWTLPTMPPLAAVTANVNRLMLGMNPIWSL